MLARFTATTLFCLTLSACTGGTPSSANSSAASSSPAVTVAGTSTFALNSVSLTVNGQTKNINPVGVVSSATSPNGDIAYSYVIGNTSTVKYADGSFAFGVVLPKTANKNLNAADLSLSDLAGVVTTLTLFNGTQPIPYIYVGSLTAGATITPNAGKLDVSVTRKMASYNPTSSNDVVFKASGLPTSF